MVDELTRKQSKVPLDTKSKHNFSVASGPDFETLGMAAQPITYMTKSTDDEEMNFHVAGCHVADLGGSAGEGIISKSYRIKIKHKRIIKHSIKHM